MPWCAWYAPALLRRPVPRGVGGIWVCGGSAMRYLQHLVSAPPPATGSAAGARPARSLQVASLHCAACCLAAQAQVQWHPHGNGAACRLSPAAGLQAQKFPKITFKAVSNSSTQRYRLEPFMAILPACAVKLLSPAVEPVGVVVQGVHSEGSSNSRAEKCVSRNCRHEHLQSKCSIRSGRVSGDV